jgi:hypothetical protein
MADRNPFLSPRLIRPIMSIAGQRCRGFSSLRSANTEIWSE